MEIEERKLVQFHFLLDRFFEQEATQEEVLKIQQVIQEKPEFKEYYFCYVELKAGLYQLKVHDILSSPSEQDYNEMLLELSKYEKDAPEIEVPEEKPQRELIQKVVYPPREKRKISKFQIATFIMSAAAVLFLVLFIKLAPERSSVQVATVIDQINTTWSHPGSAPENGDRLWTLQAPQELRKGIVKLRYDEGVDVLVEGPAVFEIEKTGIYFEYGRLYSRVSNSGMGFTVQTPTTTFIDLGTEFGIQSDVNGSAELHVIKGKVQLFADLNDGTKTSQLVTKNKAVRYDATKGVVKDITVEEEAFVRSIDSSSGSVWRGQRHLSLADMAAGGDGLGTGDYRNKIDYFTGETIQEDKFLFVERNDRKYVTTNNPFIDGVFIPDGAQTGQVIVSSQGDVYHDCPNTCGRGSRIVFNYVHRVTRLGDKRDDYDIVLNGKSYGTIENPSLFMHANNAMTFDLEAIRKKHPGLMIQSFSALCGLNDNILSLSIAEPEKVSAEFIVLVDGRQRYRGLAFPSDTAASVNVTIEPDDRFLTLMVTDGRGVGPTRPGNIYSNDHDHCIWARPFLEVDPILK